MLSALWTSLGAQLSDRLRPPQLRRPGEASNASAELTLVTLVDLRNCNISCSNLKILETFLQKISIVS